MFQQVCVMASEIVELTQLIRYTVSALSILYNISDSVCNFVNQIVLKKLLMVVTKDYCCNIKTRVRLSSSPYISQSTTQVLTLKLMPFCFAKKSKKSSSKVLTQAKRSCKIKVERMTLHRMNAVVSN